MTTSASLVYTIPQGGARAGDLATVVEAVPIPLDVFQALGLRVTSDGTSVGPPVVRTIGVGLVPSGSTTATCETVPGDSTGSRITGVRITSPGAAYVAVPTVKFSDTLGTGKGAAGRAYLDVANVVVNTAGSGYSAAAFVLPYGGLPPRNGPPQGPLVAGQTSYTFKKVLRASFTGGNGYSNKTVVTFAGGLTPRGKPAQASVRVAQGVVIGIDMNYLGDEYVIPPVMTIVDPTGAGSGATAAPYMVPGKTIGFQGAVAKMAIVRDGGGGIFAVTISDPGDGYVNPPTLLIFDPAGSPGSGGVITPNMQIGKVVMSAGGVGYQEPVVTFVPYFESLFPNGGDQRAPLYNLMTKAIAAATATPVVASAPVLS
jgi:hypothetical protein